MQTVRLENGTELQIGTLKYGAYKKIKQILINRLADQLVKILNEIEGSLTIEAIAAAFKKNGPALLSEIASIFDQVNTQFLAGCIATPDVDCNDLPLQDVRILTAAALAENSIENMLALEKNLPVGALAKTLLAKLPQGTAKDTLGTLQSSLHLYDPAGDSAS